MLLVLAGVLAVLGGWAPGFFGRQQLLTLLTTSAPVWVVGCGVALVMVTREIDISVGSQFAWCSVLVGLMVKAGVPVPVAAVGGVLAGLGMGAVNGVLVAGLGLPSIVTTLATLVTWREALRWWREGEFVRDLPVGFQWFGLDQVQGQAAILVIAGLVFGLMAYGASSWAAGRYVYAVGSDREAARLAGVGPRRVVFGVFCLTGGLVGVAAVLNAVRFSDIDPKTGTGLEMQAVAASVVGGVAVSGGRGSLCGVLLGVLLLGVIAPALVFLHFPPQWEKAIQGGVILLAVAADGRSRRVGSGLDSGRRVT